MSDVTVPAAWLSPPGTTVPAAWIEDWPAPPEGVVFLQHATVSVTAFMPGLTVGTVVALDVAAVTVTAYDVTAGAASNTDVPLDHADVAVTAFDVTVLRGTVVGLDSAPITVTAFDVTPVMGAAIPLDAAALTIAAYDVGVSAGSAGAVQLDHATVTVTAYDPVVMSETVVALDTAMVTVEAYDVTVAAGRTVALDHAAIEVAAQDVTVTAERIVPLGTVDLAVTAHDVTVSAAVALDAAAITVTAFDVTPVAAAGVGLDAADITVTAYDVGVTVGRSVALDVAAVTVTAFDVTPAVAKSVNLDTATMTVETYDPLLSITTVTTIGDTPSITITAYDVTVDAGSSGTNVGLDTTDVAITAFDVTVTAGSGAPWLNHVAINAPRNATTTHTVTPSSGTVAAGTLFTPTAGRRLVCVVEGAVTSTTPSGWTLPTNGSAVNNTGLYVWHRVAAGSDSLTTTHNASNYPCIFHFFEFPSTATFVGCVSATGVAYNAANPNLTGLSGTNHLFGVAAVGIAAISGGGSNGYAWTGTPTPTELVDSQVLRVVTDGYLFGLCYVASSAASSFQPTGTATVAADGTGNKECLTFAISA